MVVNTRLFSIQRFLLYLLVLFLPTQFGKHFWPEFSYIRGIRSDYLSPTIYSTDVLIFFLLCTSVLFFLSSRAKTASGAAKTRDLIGFSWIPAFLPETLRVSMRAGAGMTLRYWKLVVLVVFLLIGILLSSSPLAGLYGFIKVLEMVFIGFFVSQRFSNTKDLKKELFIISLLLSVSVLFESFLAIFQFVKQGSVGGLLYFFGERTFTGNTPGIANVSIGGELMLRPYGTLPHPNVLAGFLATSMTFLLFVYRDINQTENRSRKNVLFELDGLPSGTRLVENYLNKTSRLTFLPAGRQGQTRSKNNFITRILLLVALSLGTITLALTFSRISILLWIGVVVFTFAKNMSSSKLYCSSPALPDENSSLSLRKNFSLRSKNNLRSHNETKPSLSIFLIGIFIVFLLFFSPLQDRFFGTRIDEEAIATRIELMSASLKMIADYPLFGVGLNNFLGKIPDYLENKTSGVFQPAHNMYVLIAAQCGIIIFISILLFIKKTMLLLFRKIQKTKNPFDTAVFMSLIMLLIIGFFDHYLLTLQQGQLLLSFFLGAAFVKMKNKKA